MTPVRSDRSALDVLVWLPGCFYAVLTVVALFGRSAVAGPLLGAVGFLLFAAAHRAQAQRVDQLERALLERSREERLRAGAPGATP